MAIFEFLSLFIIVIVQQLKMFLQGSKLDGIQSVQSRYSTTSKQLITFHDPFKRLAARKAFQSKYNRMLNPLGFAADYFAIFDALEKRGGLKTVSYKQKWNQIYMSLPYYKTKDMVTIAHEIYKILNKNLGQIGNKYDFVLQGVESYPLTSAMSMCSPYYKRTVAEEEIFRGGSFENTDQYLNIKCIASQNKFQIHHIPAEYRQKCILLRKWLIMFGFIQEKNYALNDIYGFNGKTDHYHVLIMGLSVPNLILAKRLTRFGINNTVFIDQSQSNQSINELFQEAFIDLGILFFEKGTQCPKYQQLLNQGFQLEIIERLDREIVLKRQFDKRKEIQLILVKPEKLLNTFIAILDEMSAQVHSKAPFLLEFQKKIKQIQQKMSVSQILMLDEVSLTLNYLIQKQLLLTKMKGEYTTVSQLGCWLKTTKNYKQGISCVITSWNSDFRINILKGPLKSISKKDNNWKLQYSQETKLFSHMIFGNTTSILKSLKNNDYKVEKGAGEMFQQGFPVLQQLGYQQFVHLALKFNELKQSNVRFNLLGIQNEKIGWVFVFFNFERKTAWAFSRISEAKKNLYTLQEYKSIMTEIVELCTADQNFKQHLAGPPFCKFSTTFFMKDERFIDYLLLARQEEKMYFNLPVITSMHPEKLESQTQLCKAIQGKILLQIFDCKFYDLRALEKYIDKEVEKQKKLLLQKHNESGQNPSKSSINDHPDPVNKVTLLTSPNIYSANLSIPESDLYHLPKDCFGLDHPVVYKHILFVRKQFESAYNQSNNNISNEQIDDILRKIAPLQIVQPIELSNSIKLLKLGHFEFIQYNLQNETFTYIPKDTKNIMSSFLLADYMVKRQGISFFYGHNIKTNFFQYLLAINGQQFYAIVDQQFPQYVFFQKQLKDLLEFVQCQTNIVLASPSFHTKNKKLIGKQQLIPDNLLPDRIKQIVANQISQIKKLDSDTINMILKRKIQIFRMGSSKAGAKLFQNSLSITPKICVMNEVNKYLSYQCRINRLKPLSLFDIMTGKLDILYLIAEMTGINFKDRIQKKIKSLEDILNQDKQLYFQIEEALGRDYSKTKRYSFFMNFDKGMNIKNVLSQNQPIIPSTTTFTREFLCKYSTSPKTLMYEFSVTDFIHPRNRRLTKRLVYYISLKHSTGFNSQFLQSDCVITSSQNIETLMENLTQILLNNWSIQEIITAYQQLIDDEINMTHQFPKIFKSYHKMTRIRNYNLQHMHIPLEIKQKILEEKLNSKDQKIILEAIQSSKLFFTQEGATICAL